MQTVDFHNTLCCYYSHKDMKFLLQQRIYNALIIRFSRCMQYLSISRTENISTHTATQLGNLTLSNYLHINHYEDKKIYYFTCIICRWHKQFLRNNKL